MPERIHLSWAVGSAVAICAAVAAIGTPVAGAVELLLAALGTVLVAGFVAGFLRTAAAHSAVARRLRARSAAEQVAGTDLRVGQVGGAAFVAGLVRPDIFCDRSLLDELNEAELQAVTLHERAHQLARDPLRTAAVAPVAPLLRRFERGRAWLERRAANREIAADHYALAHGACRPAIASALLKVPTTGHAHAAGFAPAAELRLRALLDDQPQAKRRPRLLRAAGAGALVAAVGCLTVLHVATVLAADTLAACCPV
jgi:beta-lactamase regulating signal transducer with metallopeptidase domain